MIKVAIIDSGIEKEVLKNVYVKQYRIFNQEIIEERAVDYVNHGTSMAYVAIVDNYVDEVISICPGIDSEGNVDELINPCDMAMSIKLAADSEANIINISMGTNDFCNRNIIDEACEYAYKKGSIIVCGTSSDGLPSMPWASKKVLKVWHIDENRNEIRFERVAEVFHIVVYRGGFRTRNRENKQFIGKHNSMATAWVTNKLLSIMNDALDCINTECSESITVLRNKVECFIQKEWCNNLLYNMYEQRVDIIKNMKIAEKMKLGNICIVPFNKEMHSIVRFEKNMRYKIVAAIDSPRKGLIGKDIGELIGLGKRGVEIVKDMSDVNKKVDTLIVGYLDEIQRFDYKFSLDTILEANLIYIKANIFSFIPISDEWCAKYEKFGLKIKSAPYIDLKKLISITENIPYNVAISKPVVGVFGTSSSQGKFTLQLYIKNCMKKRGVKCTHLSTEHQGEILGADGVFPFGYERNLNINLPLELQKIYIEKFMIYLNYAYEGDFILVGGQSGVIPYSINYEGFLNNAVFLEGVKPDLSILVYNPYMDDEEYVKDCMAALKSIYKCRTIAMAFSDSTKKLTNGKWKKNKLDEDEKDVLSQNEMKKYNLPCGCITDEDYIEYICDKIIDSCS